MKTQITHALKAGTRLGLFLLLLSAGLTGVTFGQNITACECWDAVTNWEGTFTIRINDSGVNDVQPFWTETWQMSDVAQGSFEIVGAAGTATPTGSGSVSENDTHASPSCTSKTDTTGSGQLDPQSTVVLELYPASCTYGFDVDVSVAVTESTTSCSGAVTKNFLRRLAGGFVKELPAFGENLSGSYSPPDSPGVTLTWNIEPVLDQVPPKFNSLPRGGPLGCNPIDIPNDFTILDMVDATAASGHLEIEAKHADVTNGCKVTRTFTLTARDKCLETEAHAMVAYWWSDDKEPPTILGLPYGGDLGLNPANPPDDAAIKSQARPVDNCIDCEPEVHVSHVDHMNGGAVMRVFAVTAIDCCGNVGEKTVSFSWKVTTTTPGPVTPPPGVAFGFLDISLGTTTNTLLIHLSASPTNGGTPRGGGVFAAGSFGTLVASANRGYAFRDWTENGVVVSSSPAYSFTLERDRELVANFVPGSYAATKNTYTGLFYEPEGVAQRSSGSFTLATTATGKFTAKFQLGAARYSATGEFDSTGQASAMAHSPRGTLTVKLQVAENGGEISGTVSDGTWTANLAGDSAGFNGKTSIAPQAGQYTMILAGEPKTAAEPGGYGYGTLTVDNAGRVRLSAVLADATRLTQAGTISTDGIWAIYVPLYGGQGSVLSWVAFADSGRDDLRGDVVWIKGSYPRARYYPSGFATEMAALGSKFARRGASGITLSFSEGSVMMAGAGLTTAITNRIKIGPKDQVTNLETTKLNLVFSAGSGLFNGNLLNAQSSHALSFSGVVLQKRNIAAGCFLGTGETGRVIVQPEP